MKIKLISALGLFLLGVVLIDTLWWNHLDRWLGQNGGNTRILRVGTSPWPGYEPLFLARDLAYYQQPIQLIEYPSTPQASRALRNGEIQAATLTLDEVVALRQFDVPLRVIALLDRSHGGDAILARPTFPDMAALKGHRIGVESSVLGTYVLSRALQLRGMSQDDVVIVPLETYEHERAFSFGEIDAVVTYEPVSSRILAAGANRVFDSTEMPGEILDVLVAREEVLQTHRAALRDLIESWLRALVYLNDHPEEAELRIAKRMQAQPEEVAAMLKGLYFYNLVGNQQRLEGQPCPLQQPFMQLLQAMRAAKLLEREANGQHLCEPAFVEQLR